MKNRLFGEQYIELLELAYEGREVYNKKLKRPMTWVEIYQEFVMSGKQDEIFNYVNNVLCKEDCEIRKIVK